MEGRGWPERGEPAPGVPEGKGVIFINTVDVAFKAHPENGWAFYCVHPGPNENQSGYHQLVKKAEAYKWSSAQAHIMGFRDDILSKNWLDEKEGMAYKDFMTEDGKEVDMLIRKATSTGRPLGTERFIKILENLIDRGLLPKKAGRPKKKKEE